MPRLSIIVPVYNSERHLPDCINSILSQTFKDFELILVDDGSTDNSLAVCKSYEKADMRIKVLSQKNGGPGKARNAGLAAAEGEWIGFVDSDDWIDSATYETAINTAEEKNADLVQWELVMEYPGRSVPNKCKPDGFFTAEQSGIYYRSVVYASIYKKEIIKSNDIYFPIDSKLSEDALFNYRYYLKADRCFYLGKCFYHFRQNSSSITHNVTREMILGKKKVIDEISKLSEQNGGYEYVQKIKRNAKIQSLLWTERPDYHLFRALYPEIRFKNLVSPEMSFLSKLWYLLIYCRLDFFAGFMFKVKKIISKDFKK